MAERVQVRPREEPGWETWKSRHDMCPAGNGASCFGETVASRFLPPHALPCTQCMSHLLTIKRVLTGDCKPGSGLTSCRLKRKGSAASYPGGREGEKPDSLLTPARPWLSPSQLHLLSRRKATRDSRTRTGEPRRERGKREFCHCCIGQAPGVPRLPSLWRSVPSIA